MTVRNGSGSSVQGPPEGEPILVWGVLYAGSKAGATIDLRKALGFFGSENGDR